MRLAPAGFKITNYKQREAHDNTLMRGVVKTEADGTERLVTEATPRSPEIALTELSRAIAGP